MPMIHATTSVELEQENRARSTHASVIARNGATELLGALEKFVSAMIHTYHRQIYLNNTLREDNPTTPPKFEDKSSTLVRAANQHEDTTDENENQKSMHKLLGSLRQHVFNNMPIRLLRFNAIAGELKIELVERGSIYDYLASILQQKSTLDEFLSDIEQEVWWYEGDRKFAEEKVVNRWVSKTARYAILSHTWLRDAPGEVTYANWTKASIDISKPGYQKLVNFCKTATQYHGLTLG
ncbi:hypothetical protein BDN70DRAFT_971049 [Pholiota conissans]|uniref:Uncharacterized protein n=1 Tax=Pholiota conissans TaxID=109636 RepID=A0A9P5Z7I9_9AGAR|nr:hypothetical protein BDN70DRAFT_971049 [Pholiota conissans]